MQKVILNGIAKERSKAVSPPLPTEVLEAVSQRKQDLMEKDRNV
jgi:hypothetical protein